MRHASLLIGLLVAAGAARAGAQDSARTAAPAADQPYFEFQVEKEARLFGTSRPPTYPESLQRTGVTGKVIVQFVVDTVGVPQMSTFRVIESTHPLFAEAVREVLPQYRFRPAEIGGRKVRQVVQMPFVFGIR